MPEFVFQLTIIFLFHLQIVRVCRWKIKLSTNQFEMLNFGFLPKIYFSFFAELLIETNRTYVAATGNTEIQMPNHQRPTVMAIRYNPKNMRWFKRHMDMANERQAFLPYTTHVYLHVFVYWVMCRIIVWVGRCSRNQ